MKLDSRLVKGALNMVRYELARRNGGLWSRFCLRLARASVGRMNEQILLIID